MQFRINYNNRELYNHSNLVEDIESFEIVNISIKRDKQLLLLENKQTKESLVISFINCLQTSNLGLLFDELKRAEVRYDTTFVQSSLASSDIDGDSNHFIEVLIWDVTSDITPKYRVVVEEVIIDKKD